MGLFHRHGGRYSEGCLHTYRNDKTLSAALGDRLVVGKIDMLPTPQGVRAKGGHDLPKVLTEECILAKSVQLVRQG